MEKEDLLAIIPQEAELKQMLLDESDPAKIKNITELFNINQSKKDMLRLERYNTLIDSITAQMQARILAKPDEFSNKDLIDYLNAANSSIERAKKSAQAIDSTPSVQINQVNIESKSTNMSRESREKITQAIMSILNKVDADTSEDQVHTSDPVLLNEEEEN